MVTTSVHPLQKLTAIMTKNGHEYESFQDSIIFASMFQRHHQLGKSEDAYKMSKRKKWRLTRQESDLVVGLALVRYPTRRGHLMLIVHLTQLLTLDGTISLSGR